MFLNRLIGCVGGSTEECNRGTQKPMHTKRTSRPPNIFFNTANLFLTDTVAGESPLAITSSPFWTPWIHPGLFESSNARCLRAAAARCRTLRLSFPHMRRCNWLQAQRGTGGHPRAISYQLTSTNCYQDRQLALLPLILTNYYDCLLQFLLIITTGAAPTCCNYHNKLWR